MAKNIFALSDWAFARKLIANTIAHRSCLMHEVITHEDWDSSGTEATMKQTENFPCVFFKVAFVLVLGSVPGNAEAYLGQDGDHLVPS